jgi:tetratricopeptide (TPR) repeat protein
MSASAQMFRRWLLAFALTCAVAFQPATLAQSRVESVSPAQVTQIIQRVRASPDNENVFTSALALGGALLREGRFAEAAELFGALVDVQPQNPAALYGATLATFNAGRAAQAEPLARRAVDAALASAAPAADVIKAGNDRAERAADALVLLGVVLAVRGDNAGALKAVEKAVQLAPNNFDAQLALGRALFGNGDVIGSVRAFRTAVALKPSDAPALFFLATALENVGEADAALAVYRQLIAQKPDIANGHLGLGVLLLKRNSLEEGLKELLRALDINPNLYEARIAIGRALVAQGRALEAVEHLRRAAELAPGNPEPHYQLSIAYRRLGRKEEADAESAIVKRIHESRRNNNSNVNINNIQASSPTAPGR